MEKNPYNPLVCEEFCEKNQIELKLANKYNFKHFNYRKCFSLRPDVWKNYTPRYRHCVPAVPMNSFYYISYLLAKQPNQIIDLGCGMNFFKDILPVTVHGFDRSPDADEELWFDRNFEISRENQYEAVISINALNLYKPGLPYFLDVVEAYNKIIKPGGRGYLALNIARFIELTEQSYLIEKFGTSTPDPDTLQHYIYQQIAKLPMNFLVVDCLIDLVYDEAVDGNIRLVWEK